MFPKVNFRKASMVLGAFLIFLPTSFSTFWGNMSVYIISYFVAGSGSTVGLQSSWALSMNTVGVVIGLLLAGCLTCWNPKWNLLTEVIMCSVSYFIGYFALRYLLAPLLYAAIFLMGVCIGLMDSVVFKHISDCSTTDKGRLISITCAGISFGPFLINPFVSFYVNPNNLTPDFLVKKISLFSQTDIIAKVPSMFLVLGTSFLACQLIGYLLFIRMKRVDGTKADKNNLLPNDICSDYGSLTQNVAEVADTETQNASLAENPDTTFDIEKEQNFAVPEDSSNESKDDSGDDKDMTPRQLFRSCTFYILCFVESCQTFTNFLYNNYYKTYGLVSINDDLFLSFLGAAMGVGGGLALFLWGFVLDKLNIKTSLILLYSAFAFFTLSMYFAPFVNNWLYFFSVNLLASAFNCKYPTSVTLCLSYFGSKHFSTNFGILGAARIISGFAAPPVLDGLLTNFGWFSIFCWTSSLTVFDLLLIIFFVSRGKDKRL